MNKYFFATLAMFGLLTRAARCQGRDTLVDVGGYRLHFHVVPGQGIPILFDAGSGDDGTVWDSLLPPVARITHAPLITYDRAGFGKSEVDSRTTDIDSHGMLNGVEGLEAGLRALGYGERIVLVAHSFGAVYATLYASRHPTLVKGAVLVDGSIACFPKTAALMRGVTFPSLVPVIDLVSEHPPFSDSSDIARWKDCHDEFVAGQPNRQGITAYGTTHYIFRDNPPLVILAIAKAYAGAVGEPEAGAIAEREQDYAIVAVNEVMQHQTSGHARK